MKLNITVDGTPQQVDIDVRSMSLRQAVNLQDAIGDAKWDQLVGGVIRPDVLTAIIAIKLGLEPDQIDLDLAAVETLFTPTSGGS